MWKSVVVAPVEDDAALAISPITVYHPLQRGRRKVAINRIVAFQRSSNGIAGLLLSINFW